MVPLHDNQPYHPPSSRVLSPDFVTPNAQSSQEILTAPERPPKLVSETHRHRQNRSTAALPARGDMTRCMLRSVKHQRLQGERREKIKRLCRKGRMDMGWAGCGKCGTAWGCFERGSCEVNVETAWLVGEEGCVYDVSRDFNGVYRLKILR